MTALPMNDHKVIFIILLKKVSREVVEKFEDNTAI